MACAENRAKRYYWAELNPAVIIVPIHNDDVLFVRHYRPNTRTAYRELPAGIIEPDATPNEQPAPETGRETYAQAARRELIEETGYQANHVDFLQECDACTGVLRHKRGFVVARDLQWVGSGPDSNEFLSLERVSISEALRDARIQRTNDGTLLGLLLAGQGGYL